ncbi:replication factor A protein 1-like [Lotus japonicus]|uniref:replication factor A protein 1-like n=1 Tax=Lotus japonicus TaxID=34305 RepID=UPI00258ACC18|nr:replication factor A protein 1-like [Lotus japonicus]
MEFVYHNVDELRSGKQHWRILVKVVRIWYSQGFASSKLPLSLELVLMDDKGSKIHAIIKKTLMYKFEKLLVEGNVYSLSSFVLVDSSGDYKPTRHNYKICFMYNTEVRHMPHITIDEFPYSFVSLADILAPSYDSGYLIDVIGILTGVGVEREIVTNGKKSKMNVIEIESAGLRIECALFGAYVDELANFLGGGELNNPVVIIQFAKVKSFQGNNSLQNVHGATKILFDPDLPMASVLKSNYLDANASASHTLSQLSDSKSVSGEEDFLVLTSSKSIAELSDIKKDCVCVVYGTILPMEEGVDWWYTACRCSRKVYADERMFFCEGCNRHVIAVYPRFRLQLRVEDNSGSANFILFDKEATALLGKTCTEMVDSCDRNEGGTGLPVELTSVFGRSALFKIEVKNFQGQRFDRSRFETSYRVKRVCTDELIIEQFKHLQLDLSVGASSSRGMLTPQSTLNKEVLRNEDIGKDLLDEFVVVSSEKVSEPDLSSELPTTDLNANTQETISPKRSPSPDNEGVQVLSNRKKKVIPKAKKDKI